MNGPEIRIGPDYFGIDYYPQIASTILYLPIRKVETYADDAREVELEVRAESFVKSYLESVVNWSEYWRELRKC